MKNNKKLKITLLYILFILFLWGGQLSSQRLSLEESIISIYFITLYFCIFSRAIVWFIILKNMDLIKAYTISSINYLFIPFLSYFILGENIELKHIIGGLFIIGGIFLFRIGERNREV